MTAPGAGGRLLRWSPRARTEWAVLLAAPSVVAAILVASGSEPREAALAAFWSPALCTLASADLRERVIPNPLVYPLLALALLLSAAWPDRGVVEALVGGLGALAVAGAIRVLSRGCLGGGDVKMAALVGVVVGGPGVMAAGLVAAIAGGVAAATLLITGRAERSTRLPYGPFLAIGGIAALLC